MAPPSSQQITVALDALEADAVAWVRIGDELTVAAVTAKGLILDAPAFSFAGGPLVASYEALRVKMVALVEGGAVNAADVAAALRASAAAYAADERSGAHRMQDIY